MKTKLLFVLIVLSFNLKAQLIDNSQFYVTQFVNQFDTTYFSTNDCPNCKFEWTTDLGFYSENRSVSYYNSIKDTFNLKKPFRYHYYNNNPPTSGEALLENLTLVVTDTIANISDTLTTYIYYLRNDNYVDFVNFKLIDNGVSENLCGDSAKVVLSFSGFMRISSDGGQMDTLSWNYFYNLYPDHYMSDTIVDSSDWVATFNKIKWYWEGPNGFSSTLNYDTIHNVVPGRYDFYYYDSNGHNSLSDKPTRISWYLHEDTTKHVEFLGITEVSSCDSSFVVELDSPIDNLLFLNCNNYDINGNIININCSSNTLQYEYGSQAGCLYLGEIELTKLEKDSIDVVISDLSPCIGDEIDINISIGDNSNSYTLFNPQGNQILSNPYTITHQDFGEFNLLGFFGNSCPYDYSFTIVEGADCYKIPDIITPNDDGLNDTWIIDFLKLYPNNSVSIFNRWGSEIFKAAPYKNDFKGVPNTGLRIDKGSVPNGSYFYIIDLGIENEKPITGVLEIQK